MDKCTQIISLVILSFSPPYVCDSRQVQNGFMWCLMGCERASPGFELGITIQLFTSQKMVKKKFTF